MAITSKSPRRVLLVAYNLARQVLPKYAHRYAPKLYTQPQLLALLVLKAHQKEDYRGICALLQDAPSLGEVIGLRRVPHWTTLQKACARLLKQQHVRTILERSLLRVNQPNRRRRVTHAAADSTGLDSHHASRYYIWRSHHTKAGKQAPKRVLYRRFGKLMVLICCQSHLILAAVASAGPTPDVGELDRLLSQVPTNVTVERLVADAGFDSAHNHHLLRDDHGVLSVIPTGAGRPSQNGKLPADPCRRQMKTRFNHRAYARRSQVETVMSMLGRNLGDSLRGRTHHARRRDMLLMCLTHNIAILYARIRAFLQCQT